MATTSADGYPKRLLLVSYHFPPSEAAGALRWQRLAPIAAKHGWDLDVIALRPESATHVDWGRLAELPASTEIHGVAARPPFSARAAHAIWTLWRVIGGRKRIEGEGGQGNPATLRPGSLHREEITWFRGARSVVRAGNAFVAHREELAWSRVAAGEGIRIAARKRPDVVVSCGPPHLVHEAGRRIARALAIPFVMDMRDPWSLQLRLQEDVASPLWYSLAERAEARCVREADLIVMNTPMAARAMQTKWRRDRVISVLNGLDDEPLISLPWPRQFRIVYAGSIYLDRTPGPLFEAVARVVKSLDLDPDDFQIRIIGNNPEGGLVQLARGLGVERYLEHRCHVPRREVLREYAEAAVLLSLPQDSHYAIPSKVFEYVREPCWVVVQAEAGSATAELLEGSSAFVVDPSDPVRLAEVLTTCYRRFRAGGRPAPIAANDRWSRSQEGGRLMRALDELVRRPSDS